ncbi:MAG: hypothetical protein ABIA93_05255 [Candidatus Woesearchaeota archaeon]
MRVFLANDEFKTHNLYGIDRYFRNFEPPELYLATDDRKEVIVCQQHEGAFQWNLYGHFYEAYKLLKDKAQDKHVDAIQIPSSLLADLEEEDLALDYTSRGDESARKFRLLVSTKDKAFDPDKYCGDMNYEFATMPSARKWEMPPEEYDGLVARVKEIRLATCMIDFLDDPRLHDTDSKSVCRPDYLLGAAGIMFVVKLADTEGIRRALMSRVETFSEFFPEYTAFMQRTYGERVLTDSDPRQEASRP